jgi:hypothetical protein
MEVVAGFKLSGSRFVSLEVKAALHRLTVGLSPRC